MKNSNFKQVVAFAAALSLVATGTTGIVTGTSASADEKDATTSTVLGDADLDGEVLANDALIIKKHVLNIKPIDEGTQVFTNSDINGDGDVAANDLLYVTKRVLGIWDNFDSVAKPVDDGSLDATIAKEDGGNTVATVEPDEGEELPEDVDVLVDGQKLDPKYYTYDSKTGKITFDDKAIADELGNVDLSKAKFYAKDTATTTTDAVTTTEAQVTTAAAQDTTVNDSNVTTAAQVTTASAKETTAAQVTTASGKETTAAATTTAAQVTTASAKETTAAQVTTASAKETTAAQVTTASAKETTAAQVTTAAGKETTAAQVTTASAKETTAAATTTAAQVTTASGKETTAAQVTTASGKETTAATTTTGAAVTTTTGAAVTTTTGADVTTTSGATTTTGGDVTTTAAATTTAGADVTTTSGATTTAGSAVTTTDGSDVTTTDGSAVTTTDGSAVTTTDGSAVTTTDGSAVTTTDGSDVTTTEGDVTTTDGSDVTTTEGDVTTTEGSDVTTTEAATTTTAAETTTTQEVTTQTEAVVAESVKVNVVIHLSAGDGAELPDTVEVKADNEVLDAKYYEYSKEDATVTITKDVSDVESITVTGEVATTFDATDTASGTNYIISKVDKGTTVKDVDYVELRGNKAPTKASELAIYKDSIAEGNLYTDYNYDYNEDNAFGTIKFNSPITQTEAATLIICKLEPNTVSLTSDNSTTGTLSVSDGKVAAINLPEDYSSAESVVVKDADGKILESTDDYTHSGTVITLTDPLTLEDAKALTVCVPTENTAVLDDPLQVDGTYGNATEYTIADGSAVLQAAKVTTTTTQELLRGGAFSFGLVREKEETDNSTYELASYNVYVGTSTTPLDSGEYYVVGDSLEKATTILVKSDNVKNGETLKLVPVVSTTTADDNKISTTAKSTGTDNGKITTATFELNSYTDDSGSAAYLTEADIAAKGNLQITVSGTPYLSGTDFTYSIDETNHLIKLDFTAVTGGSAPEAVTSPTFAFVNTAEYQADTTANASAVNYVQATVNNGETTYDSLFTLALGEESELNELPEKIAVETAAATATEDPTTDTIEGSSDAYNQKTGVFLAKSDATANAYNNAGNTPTVYPQGTYNKPVTTGLTYQQYITGFTLYAANYDVDDVEAEDLVVTINSTELVNGTDYEATVSNAGDVTVTLNDTEKVTTAVKSLLTKYKAGDVKKNTITDDTKVKSVFAGSSGENVITVGVKTADTPTKIASWDSLNSKFAVESGLDGIQAATLTKSRPTTVTLTPVDKATIDMTKIRVYNGEINEDNKLTGADSSASTTIKDAADFTYETAKSTGVVTITLADDTIVKDVKDLKFVVDGTENKDLVDAETANEYTSEVTLTKAIPADAEDLLITASGTDVTDKLNEDRKTLTLTGQYSVSDITGSYVVASTEDTAEDDTAKDDNTEETADDTATVDNTATVNDAKNLALKVLSNLD